MVRILGIVDVIGSLLLLASFYGIDVPRGLVISIGIALIIKGLIFISNFFSFFVLVNLTDVALGIILIFSLAAALPSSLLVGLAVFLGLKGLVSFIPFS